jgi:hypothetical protein
MQGKAGVIVVMRGTGEVVGAIWRTIRPSGSVTGAISQTAWCRGQTTGGSRRVSGGAGGQTTRRHGQTASLFIFTLLELLSPAFLTI